MSPVAPPTPSYASGLAELPLLGDTIGDNLDRTAARFPELDAMVEVATGRRWNYREFVNEVDALALGMLDAGLGKGDRVGIWAPNQSSWTLV
ncbi:MAG TPA: AMP-binding protein, partial [Pseudonocardia sp.]